MATPDKTPPPDDINRFAQAWAQLQAFVNVTLPILGARVTVARGRLHK